jgi:hypothetical protein
MPQCGLAPGFIGIVAYHLCKGFDRLQDVKMRVGALPAFPTNSLKYNLTWSVDGLINEYLPSVRSRSATASASMRCRWTASSTSPRRRGVRGVQHLGRPRARCARRSPARSQPRLQERALPRPPGAHALPARGAQDDRARGELKAILRNAIPATMQDVVLIFVTVTGLKAGALVQEVFARKIFADPRGAALRDPDHDSGGICAAVDLFRAKKLPAKGFIRQEEIALPDFLANRFGKAYQSSGRSRRFLFNLFGCGVMRRYGFTP